MINQYYKDDAVLSQIGKHPKIWTPTENQVRFFTRGCIDKTKGFNAECDNRDDGTCPFCCTEGCHRIRCDWGLGQSNARNKEIVKREGRSDDIGFTFKTTYDEGYGCNPEMRKCEPIKHGKGRTCPVSPTSAVDRNWRPNPPEPHLPYNPDHVLPSQPPSIYSQASFANSCHRLNRGWPRRPWMLDEKPTSSMEPRNPLACNSCCQHCENVKTFVSEPFRSSRPTKPPGYPPACQSQQRSNFPSYEYPRVKIAPDVGVAELPGKWPGRPGEVPAKLLGQVVQDRVACFLPNARTSWKCPYHHADNYPLEKKNVREEEQ